MQRTSLFAAAMAALAASAASKPAHIPTPNTKSRRSGSPELLRQFYRPIRVKDKAPDPERQAAAEAKRQRRRERNLRNSIWERQP